MMESASLTQLKNVVHNNAKSKGFYDGQFNFGEKIALIHSEASEALEAHRNNASSDDVIEELADIIIRVLDLCGYLSADIETAVYQKIEKNAARPYKHGKNY